MAAARGRLAVRGDRFFVAALVLECQAERDVGLGEAGLELERRAAARGGLRRPVELDQQVGEVVVR